MLSRLRKAARPSTLITFILVATTLAAQPSPNDLLSKALQNPNDENIVSQVMSAFHSTKDPVALSKLRELFQVVTEKSSRRLLALLMFDILGQRDDLYFEALAKYAQEAVTSDIPLPFFYDPDGNEIKGTLTLAFTNWCEGHQVKQDVCLTNVMEHAVDVMYLAMLKDRRAIPIFRQGLASDNHGTVRTSVMGLALLNDTDSLPLIATAIRRFRPKLQMIIADSLSQYDDPRAWLLLDEFIKDPKWRQEVDDSIRRRLARPADK